ncbi:helix-turn-helix domain-containing protein [Gemmata sp. JC717]|uniref:helix-turn-helix domain-containing protein n=1 Tax=Gemmata algarum TaxID=2975278 RepID=UPI0021BBB314|nr:helix-turn-helix domain-containing protein [Gemmata algarum]MDY3551489.1 helix-turn-helix domain-containing protein [Gemmata algarum]
MTPATLRTLIKAAGGVKPFAALLRVTPRVVFYWLAGTVPVTPSRADQIERLAREQGWQTFGREVAENTL